MNPKNIKSFSSLIPSYLLKVTKFLGEISQFEFLVTAEKNIFAYKLFLSLNISDFILFLFFFLKIGNLPAEKSHLPLSQQPPSKSWGPVKPPLFENLVRGSPPLSPQQKGKGGCTVCTYHIETSLFSFGANQWTGFFMIETSVMKELNQRGAGATKGFNRNKQPLRDY